MAKPKKTSRITSKTSPRKPIARKAGRPRVLKPSEQPAAHKNGWRPRLLLRPLREARGLSHRGLAELLGKYKSDISEWETGQKFPEWGTLYDLARALGIKTLGELIDPNSSFAKDNPPA